jgi:hypothetical protein
MDHRRLGHLDRKLTPEEPEAASAHAGIKRIGRQEWASSAIHRVWAPEFGHLSLEQGVTRWQSVFFLAFGPTSS